MHETHRGGDARDPKTSPHRTGFDDTVMDDSGRDADRLEFPSILTAWTYAQEGLQAQWRRGLAINAHERLALVHLWNSGSMTMSELGERIPLSRAAITTLTDRLERMGYLKRTPDERDRRRTVLVMTDRPHRVTQPLWAEYTRELVEFAQGMDDDQWLWIIGCIKQLRALAERHADRLRAMDEDELSEIVDVADRASRSPR